MGHITVSKDIVPIEEFKTNPSKWFKNAKETRHPIIVTQNGKATGVILSPVEYDLLMYEKRFIESIREGLEDTAADRTMTTEELKQALDKELEENSQ